ncbi:protein Wiz [Latimeria chalumnae]|uniref:protein Wiz n=1 Tax=Latimeria chalumnae TaxID=7897 RepID=UPI0003C1953D|nr:PREDICTED: protein Wiz [Latimeria chalumnae]XP_006002985.1 PREDICTED: protein Wiz [Latimeria chalumnae]|eukprot:XP_006002984.1 PREDICTED: protein Wiz [Latimeria chalumnae]
MAVMETADKLQSEMEPLGAGELCESKSFPAFLVPLDKHEEDTAVQCSLQGGGSKMGAADQSQSGEKAGGSRDGGCRRSSWESHGAETHEREATLAREPKSSASSVGEDDHSLEADTDTFLLHVTQVASSMEGVQNLEEEKVHLSRVPCGTENRQKRSKSEENSTTDQELILGKMGSGSSALDKCALEPSSKMAWLLPSSELDEDSSEGLTRKETESSPLDIIPEVRENYIRPEHLPIRDLDSIGGTNFMGRSSLEVPRLSGRHADGEGEGSELAVSLVEESADDITLVSGPVSTPASSSTEEILSENQFEHLKSSKECIFENTERIKKPELKLQHSFPVLPSHEAKSPNTKDVKEMVKDEKAFTVREQTAEEDIIPLNLHSFKKTLNPTVHKQKPHETIASIGKPTLNEFEVGPHKLVSERTLQRSHLMSRPRLWNLGIEDTAGPNSPGPLEPGPSGIYDIDKSSYVCDVMLDSQGKEDLTPEEEPSVYTCIECSIYFKKKEHLLEHMHQHHQRQRQDQAGETVVGPQCSFMCQECGWAFEDISTLEQHRRLHQESREKIIEEIQKLNEFPDEGREARLQCPKCIFGTNSSKIFVQHAKTHVKEKRDQETRKMFGSPSHERRGSPMLQIYQHFHHNELPTPKHLLKSHYCCRICGFPSPSENVLKEHMKYSHPHLFSEKETFEDSMSLPGTSKDMYGLQSPSRYSEAEFASSSLTRNADKMLLPSSLESVHMFGDSQQRPSLNSGVQRDPKAPELPMTPPSYTSPPKAMSASTAVASQACYQQRSGVGLQYAMEHRKNQGIAHLQNDNSFEDRRDQQEDHHSQQEAPYPSYFSWISEVDETGEEASSSSDVDVLEESKGLELLEVPPAALEIKRTFRENLREAGSPVTSDEQEHQLRMMVPVVVIETLNVFPKRLKRARYKARMKRKKRSLALEDLSMEEVFSLDQFLAEHPVDDSQEAENALGEDSSSLKNEEKKCPYCSDRFHNGIGLANHIRGHLNRVGVSYNVRHFISAEEVKAIEQKFSFQKKKKKVANFDPDTFSLMRCEFCGAGFDTRAGLSSHARAHLRDFGITNWEVTISPINILRELLSSKSERPLLPPRETRPPSPSAEHEQTGYTPEGAAMTPKGSMPRSPLSPFASPWGEESVQSYQDVMGPEEERVASTDLGSPPTAKRSGPPTPSESNQPKLGGSKQSSEQPAPKEHPDFKSLHQTTCEACGISFETRKGLSSHARSHLRQLGVAESESSGAPIDLLNELIKQKGKLEELSETPSKKPAAPKEGAGPPRSLSKPGEPRLLESPVAKQTKTGQNFSPKGLTQAGPQTAKKGPVGGPCSPPHRSFEHEKGSRSPISSPQSPSNLPWTIQQKEEETPLNLTVEGDVSSDIVCRLCGAWFETRKGLSSHARSHLRHFGVNDPDSKGSPIDILNDLLKNKDFKKRMSSALPADVPVSASRPIGGSEGSGMKNVGHLKSSVTKHSLTESLSPPPAKKLKPEVRVPTEHGNPLSLPRKGGATKEPYWVAQEQMSPLNLSATETEPVKDIPCDFCGEYFENRKGLSSHARSHLRQLGVTEWYVNGSPIDTLREMMKRRSQPRAPSASQGQKTLAKPSMSSVASAESRPTGETPSSTLQKKFGPPVGHVSPGSPTARKMFPGLPSHSLQRKMKVNPTRMEIKREIGSGSFQNNHLTAGSNWPVQDDLSPLNLSTESEGERDVRCDFCGEYFENRKGLSSHARSHLRHLGVTEWSVNGSPIDTLRELLKKKSKPSLIKKEPSASFGNPLKQMQPDRTPPKPSTQVPKSPSKMVPMMSLSPLGGKSMKHNLGGPPMSRSVPVSPIPKSPSGFLSPLLPKRPLQEERSLHSEPRHKHYIQTELPFKPKPSQEKTSTPHSTEASCELCGLYFENRKALASHARAHLRQFGVTEWCVNGSPIETLSEWIRRRPQKAGAYRSYVQGGRSFSRKFRSSAHASDRREAAKALSLNLQSGGMPTASKTPTKEPQRGEGGKMAEPMGSAERPAGSPLSPEDAEELQQHSLNKIECRQQRVSEICAAKGDEVGDVRQKMDETRSPPPRIRMVPSLVPKPPQTSLVKFVGNIYTLKCRFCEAEFRGPLSIQEEWVRHLQRHILNTNFPKAAPPQEETTSPEVQVTTNVS